MSAKPSDLQRETSTTHMRLHCSEESEPTSTLSQTQCDIGSSSEPPSTACCIAAVVRTYGANHLRTPHESSGCFCSESRSPLERVDDVRHGSTNEMKRMNTKKSRQGCDTELLWRYRSSTAVSQRQFTDYSVQRSD